MSYFTEPLVLLGIVLFFAFFICKYLIKHNHIKQLPVQLESKAGQILINHGYVLPLLLVCLGVGLKQNEINESAQIYALSALKSEYEHNISTLKSLSDNTTDTLDAYKQMIEQLHSSDSKILNILFPKLVESDELNKLNRNDKIETDANKQVTAAFEKLKSQKLLKSKPHMSAFNAVKTDINKQINQQLQSLSERQDKSGELYSIKDATWRNYREELEDTCDFNVPAYQANLQQLKNLLNQYRNTLKQTEGFLTQISEFTRRNTFISNGDVYEILIKEQSIEKLLTEFDTELKNEISVMKLNAPSFQLNKKM